MDVFAYQNSTPGTASLPAAGPLPVSSSSLGQTLEELSAPSTLTKLSPSKRELVSMIRSAEDAYAYMLSRYSESEEIMKLFAGARDFPERAMHILDAPPVTPADLTTIYARIGDDKLRTALHSFLDAHILNAPYSRRLSDSVHENHLHRVIPNEAALICSYWSRLVQDGTLHDWIGETVHKRSVSAMQLNYFEEFMNAHAPAACGAATMAFFSQATGDTGSGLYLGVLTAVFINLCSKEGSPIRIQWGDQGSLVREVHALEAMTSSPSFESPFFSTPGRLLQKALKNCRLSESALPEADKAFELIHTLRLLGATENEITSVVGKSRYHRKRKTFPRLESAIEARRKALGLSDDGEFLRVLEALKFDERIDMLLQRRKAREAAIETLLAL